MLLDAWTEHLGYPELRKKVISEWATEYGTPPKGLYAGQPARPRRPDRIIVEAKASGQSLLQDLRLAKVPAVAYNPGAADKVARAHQVAPTLELGIMWIPESAKTPGHFIDWAQPVIKQIAKFPRAAHDEHVDCLTQAVIYLKNDNWFQLPEAKDYDEPRKVEKERINPYAV